MFKALIQTFFVFQITFCVFCIFEYAPTQSQAEVNQGMYSDWEKHNLINQINHNNFSFYLVTRSQPDFFFFFSFLN